MKLATQPNPDARRLLRLFERMTPNAQREYLSIGEDFAAGSMKDDARAMLAGLSERFRRSDEADDQSACSSLRLVSK